MSIHSVSSGTPPQSIQRAPEAAEVNKGGRDNDGDADDAANPSCPKAVAVR